MSIKVYLFKEDPPFLNLTVWPVTIWFTKRNLIYVTAIAGGPAFFLILSLFGAGNVIVWLIINILAIIVWYVLSIFRIENIPMDRYFLNKFIYSRKKIRIESFDWAINFSKWKKFEDVIKSKINNLVDTENKKPWL